MLLRSLALFCVFIWTIPLTRQTTVHVLSMNFSESNESSLFTTQAVETLEPMTKTTPNYAESNTSTPTKEAPESATIRDGTSTSAITNTTAESNASDVADPQDQTSAGDVAAGEDAPSPAPGYSFPLVSEISEVDYIYGPVVIGLSFLSTIIIVLTFMRKSMRSPTTIILTGIVVSDTLKSVLRYGNYLYIYFSYGAGTVDIVLPYCTFLFYSQKVENIFYSNAQALWVCLAIQRVLVIKFPFQSREILTTKASLLTVAVCIILAVLYRLPELYFSGKLTSFRDFLIISGYKPSDFYYYYYYYYYDENDPNGTVGYETYIYSTIAGDEDLCMTYQDPAFTKAFDIYHPICSMIPFFIYIISSIYIIYSVVARNESTDIHESKGRMQRIEMMTRSILIILLVQCIEKTFSLFNIVITFLTKMEIYDVWGKMDLEAMKILYKFREIVSAAASLVKFWIIVGACEQFRKEIYIMFTACCKAKGLRFKHSVKKLAESTSSTTTKGSSVPAKEKTG